MKILLVDDTKTDRLIMSACLGKMGHEVVTAENGIQAIDSYSIESPDLVLMDVNMPEMDGHTAARTIRQTSQDWVPIIFLSARVTGDDIAAGIEAGGDDYLTKPVEHKVLEAKMRAMQRISEMRGKLIRVSADLEEANKELKQLVNLDGLTGISNRRYMDSFLDMEIARSVRNHHPLTVILADVDHFKLFNDHYGHLEGDDCLKEIARVLSATCNRATDLVARYGGEEFVVILPNTPAENSLLVAECLRKAVEGLAIPHIQSPVKDVCTISMGVYTLIASQQDVAEDVLKKADQGLYRAKQSGRNQAQIADSIN